MEGIEFGLDLPKKGLIWRIGNGRSIQITRDQWIMRREGLKAAAFIRRSRLRWVNQLIDPVTKEWKVELVKQVFHEFDADEICKLRIPREDVEDCVAWHYEKSGIFTVKSAYKLADSIHRNKTERATSSSRELGDRIIWDVIWKANIPEKVKIFGWRVATNSLPTKHNTFRRTIVDDNVCEICGMEKEDEFHAIITCTRSRALRHAMRNCWELPRESDLRYSGVDWLQMLLLSQTENVRNNILLVLWQAWSLRNNLVHGDKKDTVFGSVQYLLRLKEDLMVVTGDPTDVARKNKQSLFPERVCTPVNLVPSKWFAPDPGKVKLNCDATYFEETGETWGGAVARNHKGYVLVSIGRRLGCCNSTEEAEGAATMMGLTEFSKAF